MAAPGDPKTPDTPQASDDHDDLIGFTSPSSLTGAARAVDQPVASTAIEDDEIERDLFEPRPLKPEATAPRPSSKAASDLPEWARETVRPARPEPASKPRLAPEGAMGLYTVYALILFAVPTMGVSAAVGILAVINRATPAQDLARSHFEFQKRTLFSAAIGAVLGVVLILVNLGVFVLFILAVWVLLRGAVGVLRLASGRPMTNPKTLFF